MAASTCVRRSTMASVSPLHHRREFTLQRAHCRLRRLARAGIDQIRNRFGLRQIELVVEKGALREFARMGQSRAKLQHSRDYSLHDHRSAVPVQLEHVLARVGMRRRKEQREACVDRLLLRSP